MHCSDAKVSSFGLQAKKIGNHMFSAYKAIILINTNLITISCIKYWGKAVVCELTVRGCQGGVSGDMHKGVMWLASE
jgi:hypothetical protein